MLCQRQGGYVMGDPAAFYTRQIEDLKKNLMAISKKEIMLSYSRLATFSAALFFFAVLYGISHIAAIATGILLLVLFGWLVKYHNRVIRLKEFNEYLLKVNEAEAASIEGRILDFPDGSEFIRDNRDHYYSSDLDIFGRNSVYQLVNRTSTRPASELMAKWLTTPADVAEITERQGAVCDMRERTGWRQKMRVIGLMHKESGKDPGEILSWIRSPEVFGSRRTLKNLVNLLTLLTFAAMAGQFLGLPPAALVLVLIVNFLVNFFNQKQINTMHHKVSRSSNMLLTYSETITLIEKESFTSRRLVALQDRLKETGTASSQIQELSSLVSRLDVRLNVLVSLFLNMLWFWDIRTCFSMDRWKYANAAFIGGWFDAMAEMEVISGFANISFNNPEWAMPLVRNGNFHLDAVGMGHPLIASGKRVNNDLKIPGPGKILLITGSNMSGKSTFLRTAGVNLVLAFAGSAVCASSFRTAPVKLITSMRVADSLEENTSTFYAELKRLSMIINESSYGPSVFLLLDEILHGTNSNDRHIGSVALLRQLLHHQASAMVATHDLALSGMEKEYQDRIVNYNFDVKIEGEELYFDYRLNRGVCSSMNATLLMKKMGIDIK
jgi:DNA mismatch repair ATPase MutS